MSERYVTVDLHCTEQQKKVIVEPPGKNTLINVLSGPGTGKTKTLCDRIAYLMSNGVKPSEIAVFSLTNQAVLDFKKSLSKLLGNELSELVSVSTIHGYANSILLQNSKYWDVLKDKNTLNSSILSSIIEGMSLSRKENYIKIMEKLSPNSINNNVKYLPKISERELKLLKGSDIQKYKQYLSLSPHNPVINFTSKNSNIIFDKLVYEATLILNVNNLILSNNGIENDDELINLTDEFRIPTDILNLKEIIIDEFQDLSVILLDFVLELSKNKQLTISGDMDQSLYGFNNATPYENMERLVNHYKQPNHNLKHFVLNKTFRLSEDIHKFSLNVLGASDTFITNFPNETTEIPIIRKEFTNLVDEFSFVYNEINHLIENSNGLLTPKNFAVLAPVNQVLDNFQTYFQNKSSKFRCKKLSGLQPWQDTKLSSVVSFLKILDNPHHDPSLLVVLSFLNKIGPRTVLSLKEEAENDKISIYELIHKNEKIKKKIGNETIEKLDKILTNIDKSDPTSIIYNLSCLSDLFYFSKQLKTESLFDNYKIFLKELFNNLEVISKIDNEEYNILSYFLSHYQDDFLNVKELDDTEINKFEYFNEFISLSTIHNAKGLEWDIVFVLSSLCLMNNEYSIQKSRVNYVAATRAKHILYFNKSKFDQMLHVDTSNSSIYHKSFVKIEYEPSLLDCLPELKNLTKPNKLTNLPKFANPLSDQKRYKFSQLVANKIYANSNRNYCTFLTRGIHLLRKFR